MKIPVKVNLPGCIQQRSEQPIMQVANSFPSRIRCATQYNTKAHTHIWRRTCWLTKKSFNSLQSFYLAMFLLCAAYFGGLRSAKVQSLSMVIFVQGNASIHDLYRLTSEILVVHTMCASAGPKATDLHALRVAQSIPTASCLSSFLSHPYAAQNKRFRFTFLCKHIGENICCFYQ